MTRLRAWLACGAASIGAAVGAIALSLAAMGVVVLALGASGVGGVALSGHPLHVAVEDGAVAFYLAQLVSVSFFHHTAALRFVALPGLALVAVAIATATMVAVRVIGGSARRRMLVALAVAIPYALLAGLGARHLSLSFTGPYIGKDTAVQPAGIEAFLFPLVWALLFAPMGALVGIYGRRWRDEVPRALGAWATPVRCALTALAIGLALACVVAIVGGGALAVSSGALRAIASGSVGHVVVLLGGVLAVLPTLVLGVFLSFFGVSFDWRVEALSRTQGSSSMLGGTLPRLGANPTHDIPAALALMLVLAAVTVVSSGWLTARRTRGEVRLSLVNALRAGVLMTLLCWLFGLLARIDAQAGGFLGLHLQVDAPSLLWRVPLWCLGGSLIGCVGFIATRGASSRRELAATLRRGARPVVPANALDGHVGSWRAGLAPRSALALSFLSLPAILIGIGSAGATSATPAASVSLAPITRSAEQGLRRDAVAGSPLSLTVDPNTRVIDSARAHIPLSTLGVPVTQSPLVKAKTVLARYGDLFGITGKPDELGDPEVLTDAITNKKSRVDFKQIADGVPVFGGSIGVHLSADGRYVNFISGSFVPEVTVANPTATVDAAQAISLAKTALPDGRLVHAPQLEVYAGAPSHEFGSAARLAWFVWLAAGPRNASNEYVIDATTGSILHVFVKSFDASTPDVEVYNEEHTVKNLPGKLVRTKEKTSTEEEANKAYTDAVEAFEFFRSGKKHEPPWYGYNGQGNKAEKLTIDYGKEAKSAEWNAANEDIVLGEGYAAAPDVIAHEYAEAISEHSANEVDEGESGAIAEGFADAMGEAEESYEKTKGKSEYTKEEEEPASKWEFALKAPGGAIRDLKEPKKFSEITIGGKKYADPETLSEYLTFCLDNDGIHENSTIISHAFYLLAQKIGVSKAARIFFATQTEYLQGPHVEFEQVSTAAAFVANQLYPGESEAAETEAAFSAVGLNGHALTPKTDAAGCVPECTFEDALESQQPAHGTASTLAMLATLYRARGELAQTSAAGHHFMPLYEANMGRITELVSRDPVLEEEAVAGLQEIAPALDALTEGKGQKFKLSASEMAKIEAALKRLAQDDRLFSGGGTLAKLIENELKWLHLSSYAGMTYAKGFARLNTEVKPLTAGTLIDPNCSGSPYHNEFQVNGFTIATPGHTKPGEVSPLVASGVACGAAVEEVSTDTCHDKAGAINETLSLELPPGDKINSTKEMESGSYIGKTSGRLIACAGEHSKVIYGVTGITSVKSWGASECPTAAISCYEIQSTFDEGGIRGEGRGYGWLIEEGEHLVFTSGSPKDTVEDEGERLENVPVSFGQFGVELCARAGKPGGDTCGSASAAWVHKNGEESQPGCPTKYGRYVARVTNAAKETTVAVQHCVYWGEYDHTQLIDSANSVGAVSCVAESTDCVVGDSKGNALYSTGVSPTAAATWTSWTGPTGASPSDAVDCPTTGLCVLGDGKATEGGGDLYYATSLGGSWTKAFEPTYGVLSVSCSSASFCVDGQQDGRIRYSTSPASSSWTEVTGIGSGEINGVSCLSSSFCAAVSGSGYLYVANTEAKIKEASGWKATDIDGSTSLQGIACTSTSSCVAVDSAGDVFKLTINGSGEAKELTKRDIDGTNYLTATSCTPDGACVAVDSKGNVFVSRDGGSSWNLQHTLGTDLTSVSCASDALCVTVDSAGHATSFVPQGVLPNHTQTIDSGNSVKAVSCIPLAAECVVSDNKGNTQYGTAVSAVAAGTWKSWAGPASPSEAVACPASSLCVLADGYVEEGIGGSVYYASSLGGTWSKAFEPAYGVVALSCASTSLCVDGQEGGGYIRYATKPGSTEWTSESIGTGAMNAVDCLSSSFCAVVDSSGHVHVATTEAKIKEAAGWKSTDIEGSTALHGIACASTTLCFAIDGTGNVLDIALNSSGEATATKEDIDASNDLTSIACSEGIVCVAADSKGNVFAWNTGDEAWRSEYTLGVDLTGVSCSTRTLCLLADTAGEVTAFEPEA
jgi:Zn-dependent metalloprotease